MDMSQLQMVIADYILQLWTCHYKTVCISYGKSDLRILYLHELISCLCPWKKQPSSEEWCIAIGPWSMLDVCCVVNLCPGVFIAVHWTVTNWSSLEACLQSVGWFKVWADLNRLNHLKVIWSNKPIWNISIIQYFSSVINSNNPAQSKDLTFVNVQFQPRPTCQPLILLKKSTISSHFINIIDTGSNFVLIFTPVITGSLFLFLMIGFIPKMKKAQLKASQC
jgi:hypothetical protein